MKSKAIFGRRFRASLRRSSRLTALSIFTGSLQMNHALIPASKRSDSSLACKHNRHREGRSAVAIQSASMPRNTVKADWIATLRSR